MRFIKNIFLIIISLGLIYSGVLIIRLQLPFWSLFYGLAALGAGICMTFVTFNEVAGSSTNKFTEYHQIACANCRKNTLVPYLIEKTVCPDCQLEFMKKIKIGMTVFILFMLPLSLILVQMKQNTLNRAAEPSLEIRCEPGTWEPEICRCGNFSLDSNCQNGAIGRNCENLKYCCSFSADKWTCEKEP